MRGAKRFLALLLLLVANFCNGRAAIANDWCPTLPGWFTSCYNLSAYIANPGYIITPCHIDLEQNQPTNLTPRILYYVGFTAYSKYSGVYTFSPGYTATCYYNQISGGNPATQPLNAALNNGQPICCNIAGDPINVGTGNVFRREDDFSVGRWLAFSRYYNSSGSVANDVIGNHWRHTYSRSIQYSGGTTPTATITQEDGRATTWIETGTNPITWGTVLPVSDDLTETVDSNNNPTSWTLYRAKLKEYELYNASGQLVSIQDLGGFTTTFQYSTTTTPSNIAPAAGLLIFATDASGRTLSFIYNSSSQLTQVHLPAGETYTYGYDGSGNLTTTTFPDGSTRHYLYNEPGQLNGSTGTSLLTGVIDESGNRLETFSYDSSNRAISNEQPNGVGFVSIVYDPNNQATVTDALGNSTIRSFGLVDGLMSEVGNSAPCIGCANVATYTRDFSGNVTSSTDFDGTINNYSYDLDNELTSRIDASGTTQQRTISQSWNSTLHLPIERIVTDANNNAVTKTDWIYNASGETVSQCTYDGKSTNINYTCGSSGTAPSGVRQWTRTYCTSTSTNCPLVGLLLTETGPRTDLTQRATYTYFANGDVQSATDPMGHTETVVAYDADGHIKTLQDSNGVITTLSYTPRGWLSSVNIGSTTTTYTYTPYGAIQTITDPDGVPTTYGYDPAHRLNKITDAMGNYIQYALDAAGNKTGEQIFDNTGTLHKSLSRTFNSVGELVKVVDGLGNTIFNATANGSYDANGNLLLSTDGFGTARQRSYDALNRLTQTIDNYNGSDTATQNTKTAFSYDSLSRLAQVTDPSGFNTTYTFDGLNDATTKSSPDTGSTTRTYDSAGNVLTVTDSKGVVATNTYDPLNRLLTTTYSDVTQNITYSYDDSNGTTNCSSSYPLGRLTRIIEQSVTTIYCYDPRGNVTEKQQMTAQGTDVTNYTITASGRLSGITYPSGTVVSYTRDGDGRIQSVTAALRSGPASLVASNVTYLPFGPVSSYTLGNGQAISRIYDANYRLIDLASPAFSLHLARDVMGDPTALGNSPGASPALETYGFDPLYRLTSITESGGTTLERVTYNQSGDRLTETGTGLATGTYSYNPNTHQLIGVGSSARTIDADGNTTAISGSAGTFGFGYSARNRMTVVQLGGNTISSYTYNALGQRVQKLVSGVADRFDYNERGQIIGEYSSNSRDYVWMDDIPIANVDSSGTSSTTTYVTSDHMNTPRAVSSSTGATIWQWSYQGNAWGEQTPTSSSYTYNLQFPGQYFDAESGLSNNYFRDYDATSGRYIQSDPLGLAGGISTYAYVGNNSLRYRDPLGLDGFGDMQGGFCPGGLCTLPPDMVQNSWGTPNMAPVYLLYAEGGLVGGGAAVAEVGLAGVLRGLMALNAVNGAMDVPTAVAAGEATSEEILGQMLDKIIDDFVTEPPPPIQEVPTQPLGSSLIVPSGDQNPCPQ